MLKKYDLALIIFYSYAAVNLLLNALRYGFFARFYITPYTTAYFFTAIAYLLAGLILTFYFSFRSLFILIIAAFIQEYTWNIPYTFLHYDVQAQNIANPIWINYMLAIALFGLSSIFLMRKKLCFSRLWILFIIFYILYLALDMPITERLSGFTWPNSLYEAAYIILTLAATSRSFKP